MTSKSTTVHNTINGCSSETESESECPVCLSTDSERRCTTYVLSCNHVVCSRCFKRIQKSKKVKNVCPLCRSALDISHKLHPTVRNRPSLFSKLCGCFFSQKRRQGLH